jgi:hypothetical protein
MITGISAVTLATHDMARTVGFYRMLGCGEDALYRTQPIAWRWTNGRCRAFLLASQTSPTQLSAPRAASARFLQEGNRLP